MNSISIWRYTALALLASARPAAAAIIPQFDLGVRREHHAGTGPHRKCGSPHRPQKRASSHSSSSANTVVGREIRNFRSRLNPIPLTRVMCSD